jgi:hypothetical protein
VSSGACLIVCSAVRFVRAWYEAAGELLCQRVGKCMSIYRIKTCFRQIKLQPTARHEMLLFRALPPTVPALHASRSPWKPPYLLESQVRKQSLTRCARALCRC